MIRDNPHLCKYMSSKTATHDDSYRRNDGPAPSSVNSSNLAGTLEGASTNHALLLLPFMAYANQRSARSSGGIQNLLSLVNGNSTVPNNINSSTGNEIEQLVNLLSSLGQNQPLLTLLMHLLLSNNSLPGNR